MKVVLGLQYFLMSLAFPCSNIQAAPIGLSRGVKKLIQTKLPNMSQLSDISDYVLRLYYYYFVV